MNTISSCELEPVYVLLWDDTLKKFDRIRQTNSYVIDYMLRHVLQPVNISIWEQFVQHKLEQNRINNS